MPLLLANPQALIEGIVITSYAIRAEQAFIYVRGEVLHVIRGCTTPCGRPTR
jgi:NADH-quinone oxidoreductase subunit F